LRVSNWTGTPVVGSSGDLDQLIVGTDATGLNTAQLQDIHFTGYLTGATILDVGSANPGEVVPASTTRLILGDVNGDTHMDAGDILPLEQALANLNGYQTTHNYDSDDMEDIFDINHDGFINNADLQKLISDLKVGQGSNSTVPEPSSLVLLGCGALALLARFYRRPVGEKLLSAPAYRIAQYRPTTP